MTDPVIIRGSKIGLHCIMPGQTLPLVRQAVERGITWPCVKNVDSAGVSVDVKAVSPKTITITRFVNEKWDSAQGVENWDEATRLQAASECVQLIFDRTNDEERAAADYFEVLNEADVNAPDGSQAYPEGWRAFGNYLCVMVRQADARGIRLALPACNSGTPEWREMVALVGTGLFGLMRRGGHILTLHEGSVDDTAAVDKGFGDTIPGAPVVLPGAGSLAFRYRYLYSLLAARGEIVPLVISEWYGGGSYGQPVADQVARMAWYDREARRDPYVLAFLPFTVDPGPGWRGQDYTYCYPAALDYLDQEKDKENVTPVPIPPTLVGARIELTGNVVLRRGAGRVPPRITAIYSGTVFRVQEQDGHWLRVTDDGWITDQYAKVLP